MKEKPTKLKKAGEGCDRLGEDGKGGGRSPPISSRGERKSTTSFWGEKTPGGKGPEKNGQVKCAGGKDLRRGEKKNH